MTAMTIDQLDTFSGLGLGSAYALVRYGGVTYKTLVSNFFGAAGPNGTNGTNGTNGAAATVTVGTVTALAAGATPTIVNAGTSAAATLNFGIPAGAAASIGVGTVTALAAGATPTIVNAGTSSAAVLNFGIPTGANGVNGSATVSIGTVTGLAAGATPTVTNSGTATAATLNFGIPVGATGASGVVTGSGPSAREVAGGTCASGYTYLIYGPNLSGSGMYLPASPALGTTIRFVDMYGNWGSNPWTLYRNGQPIMGLAQDMTVNTSNLNFSVVYGDTACGWRAVNG